MTEADLWQANRVILTHFDGYSAALLFARWGSCMLAPEPLPDSASATPAPATPGPAHAGEPVMQAAIARYGLNPAELSYMHDFNEWVNTDTGLIRIHALRFTGFEAPAELIEAQGGRFKSISELRGSAMLELTLLRQIFNLLVGGGSR